MSRALLPSSAPTSTPDSGDMRAIELPTLRAPLPAGGTAMATRRVSSWLAENVSVVSRTKNVSCVNVFQQFRGTNQTLVLDREATRVLTTDSERIVRTPTSRATRDTRASGSGGRALPGMWAGSEFVAAPKSPCTRINRAGGC